MHALPYGNISIYLSRIYAHFIFNGAIHHEYSGLLWSWSRTNIKPIPQSVHPRSVDGIRRGWEVVSSLVLEEKGRRIQTRQPSAVLIEAVLTRALAPSYDARGWGVDRMLDAWGAASLGCRVR